jgi:2-polyprenyl-3-methyl-5-hydroxy-6-metoxy-1,4-benzoquinol methylase
MNDRAESACPVPDLTPEVYARWRASKIGAITERLEHQLMLELLGDVRGRRILDVGCGDGTFALELARRGAVVSGIDASAAMVAAAHARAASQGADVHFQVATAGQIPFAAEEFDAVTAITILCFVAAPGAEFAEMARVLRPGGRFVIGELGKWSTWSAGRRLRAWLGSRLWRGGYVRTASELRRLAQAAGLAVTQVRGAIYFPRWAPAARALSPIDPWLGRLTTLGAGFLAICAYKPRTPQA